MREAVWKILKRLIFLLPAETAHNWVMTGLRFGIRARNVPLHLISGVSRVHARPAGSTRVWGMSFHSPVGLAAGFDKDAEVVAGLPALGFGFVEIGTVTPRPQPGNAKPRLFRDPARQALFNRMGFNGQGASAAARRLESARPLLPPDFRVGVNIGKNRDTPLEQAHEDYASAAKPFAGLVDYVVVNVSSPNTPGLRSLQSQESLKRILGAVNGELGRWAKRPPLLLKLAPELQGDALSSIISALEEKGAHGAIDGWVLTNTLGGEREIRGERLGGGWSGGPLTSLARSALREARAVTALPIVSVGGILTEEEARARMDQGASLIQLYTGWIFRGPSFPSRVARHLAMT